MYISQGWTPPLRVWVAPPPPVGVGGFPLHAPPSPPVGVGRFPPPSVGVGG